MALTVCEFGHVATTAEILASVHNQHSIVDVYRLSRHIVFPRRGLYACAHLSEEELAAFRAGGLLDCVSALRVEGLDLADDGCLHVRFHPERSRARPRPESAGRPVTAHWDRMRVERRPAAENVIEHRFRRPVTTRARVPAEEAFRQALGCVEQLQPGELIDGVIEEKLLSFDVVRAIVSDAPRGVRKRLMHEGWSGSSRKLSAGK